MDRSTDSNGTRPGPGAAGTVGTPSIPEASATEPRRRSQTPKPKTGRWARARAMGRRDLILSVLAALGVSVGVLLVADGLHTPKPPPQPTAAQAFSAGKLAPAQPPAKKAGPPAVRPAPPPPPPQPELAPATPTRVRIASISVDAPLTALNLDSSKHLVPPSDRDRNLAGWYRNGTSPGVTGTAVIAGHVDTHQGPAVFYNLGALKRADTVSIDRADGVTAVFTVDAVEAYDAGNFPSDKVYGAAGRPELRLITCGAGFDKRHDRYLGNVVVYAHLTASQPRKA